MTDSQIAAVYAVEEDVLKCEQVEITTLHEFHAGMYARTIVIPADVILTGALIKIPTLLILSGDVTIMIDGARTRLTGYGVIPAADGRKQVFIAHSDTHLTMIFKTEATTIEEAENEFTDEADRLITRRQA
jgi:hypothetical protein